MSEENLIENSIGLLDKISEDQADALGNLYSAYNFGPADYKIFARDVSNDLTSDDAASLIQLLRVLRSWLGDEFNLRDKFDKAVISFFEFHGAEAKAAQKFYEKHAEKLWRVFNSVRENREWHETAIIDMLIDFDGFVDLRPVFYDAQIKDVFPVIILRAALSKDYENPRNFVFQLTADEFGKFENTVKQIRKKLDSTVKFWETKNFSRGEDVK